MKGGTGMYTRFYCCMDTHSGSGFLCERHGERVARVLQYLARA